MYHKVYLENLTIWWVDIDNFYRQMHELRCKKVVHLDQYNPRDKNQVVITFDGVYKNVYEYAFPILKKFNYPFELFITGDTIGKTNSFDTVEPSADFATRKELSSMTQHGGRLQWHTNKHFNLKSEENDDIIISELSITRDIKSLDQKGFKWFAYAHGEYNAKVVAQVRKRFKGAVSCTQGNDNKFTFKRLTVTNRSTFNSKKISVIIPSYNYGVYLPEAIESVLRQTIPVHEIVIANDSSSDATESVALKYQKKYPRLIKYYNNSKNLGIVENFNKAVSMATGDYICILGADNRYRRDFIEKTKTQLDSNEKMGIAYTDCALFGPRAKNVYLMSEPSYQGEIKEGYYLIHFPNFDSKGKKIIQKHNFIHGSSLFRKTAFVEVGGYKKTSKAEDYNLFLRMILKGWHAARVPEALLEYRQHSVNQTNIKLSIDDKEIINRLSSQSQPANDPETEIYLLQKKIAVLQANLLKIQSSKFYRIWQSYCALRDKIMHRSS